MQNFTEITSFKSTPTSIVDGQLWVKKETKLHMAEVHNGQRKQKDEQLDRLNKKVISDRTYNEFQTEMRHTSQIVAKGTVYGKASRWATDITHNSLLGVNRSCLNTNGTINYQTVIKRIREVVHSVDAKEQRLNHYYDSVYTKGFYDNFTSLLVAFQVKMHLFDLVKKNTCSEHLVTLSLEQVYYIYNIDRDNRTKEYLRLMETHPDGYGFHHSDIGTWIVLDKMSSWFEGLPPNVVQNADSIRTYNTEEYQYSYTTKIWKMYSYADGHSSSGRNFGSHFGFIQGRFAVPTHLFNTTTEGDVILIPVETVYPETDVAIKNLSGYSGALNLSGMSSLEATIVNTLLHGNKRTTPFLVDQDLDLRLGRCQIRAFNCPDLKGGRHPYSKRDLQSAYSKLVRNHRVYEESKQAEILLRYWLAQPATETVESHWWTHLNRNLRLPRLGLSRANLPELMMGDGVCISDDAQQTHEELTGPGKCSLYYSLFLNASWYWGEYMTIYNSINTNEIMKKMRFYNGANLDEPLRADALVSAITGKRMLRCAFRDCYTYVEGGLDNNFDIHVPFGKINIPHLNDYGYTVENEKIMFKKLVTPSCVALILGLNGTLLEGTPYSNMFSVNPLVTVSEYGINREGLNFIDLWGYGVLARWNGFDVYYKHPVSDARHKMYAANDVSIAVPPVPPVGLKRPESYKMDGISDRKVSWGSNFSWALEKGFTCTWEVKQMYLLDRPDWRSPKAPYSEEVQNIRPILKVDTSLVENYLGAVMSRYNVEMSDFQVALMPPGVSMPGDLKVSDVLPAEIEGDTPVNEIEQVESENG